MPVEMTREPERPHVSHLRIDLNDQNRITIDESAAIRDQIESVPDDVSVLTIGAEQPSDGVRGLTAGLDIDYAYDLSSHEAYDLLQTFYEMIEAVRNLEAVTICSCGGYAIGVGFELAIAAEFQIATSDAHLGVPEINIGLPTGIQGGLLHRMVGKQTANELIYKGETISGERAEDLGIVTRAVDEDEYSAAVDELVDEMAEKSPLALTLQKRVMKRYRSNGLEAGIHASIGDASRGWESYDQREGMDAFLEDRPPQYKGE